MIRICQLQLSPLGHWQARYWTNALYINQGQRKKRLLNAWWAQQIVPLLCQRELWTVEEIEGTTLWTFYGDRVDYGDTLRNQKSRYPHPYRRIGGK